MNTISKVIYFIFGFVCLLTSCDFSESIVDKVKDYSTNNEQYIDDEKQEEYVVNVERLDSISQNLNLLEHRVYYVDCSGSMISEKMGNKDKNGRTLLDKVKDSLEVSILNLDIDSVDIDIIPFYGRKWNNGVLQSSTIYKRGEFSLEDRKKIEETISSITVPANSNSWNTHHSIPINDFLTNRISNKKQYHIMILLTDGKDEYNKDNDQEQSGIDALKINWIKSCKNNKIYGIYDNLPNVKIKDKLPDYFNQNNSNKLFYIEGTNFNINIFQLSNITDEVMLRKDSLIRIPFGGKLPDGIELITKADNYYKYEICNPNKSEKYLKIKVTSIHNGKLPDSWSPTLHFVYNWGEHKTNTYNFPDQEKITVTIVDEKTPKLELCEADKKYKKGALVKRRLSFYKKWHGWGGEYSDTTSLSLSYSYSKDVTDDSSIKYANIRIEGLPEYVCILDSLGHNITNQDIRLPKSRNGRLDLKLTLFPGNPLIEDNIIDSVKIRFRGVDSYNTIKWNGKRIEKKDGMYIVNAVSLNVSEDINPVEKRIRWFFIFLFFSLLLLWTAIMCVRALLNKFTNNSPALQFKTNPQYTKQSLNISPSTLHSYKDYYRSNCITSIIIKNNPQLQGKHQTISWGISNFWNLRLAFSGDSLIVFVNSHNFFNEIEMKPLNNGILLQVDNHSGTIELIEMDKYKDLQCSINDSNGDIIKLTAKIYHNTIKK